jgi:hypothetical protein
MHRPASAAIRVRLPEMLFAAVGILAAGCKGDAARKADAVGLMPGASASSDAGAQDAEGAGDNGAGSGADGGGKNGGGAVVKAPLPDVVLAGVLGCWDLEDRERWTITRTAEGGARVARALTTREGAGGDPDYARRAAIPADLLYDPSQLTLAFTTAGPIHALLFVFTVGPRGLEGRWATSHAPGAGYHWTGDSATLTRCPDAGGRHEPQ